MRKIELYRGSVEAFIITMPTIEGSSLASASWKLKVWASECITINKSEAIRIADDQYKVYVHTALTGKGVVWMQLVIDMIDVDYPSGVRPQMPIYETNYIVVDPPFKGK
jgi:hypothetical protein